MGNVMFVTPLVDVQVLSAETLIDDGLMVGASCELGTSEATVIDELGLAVAPDVHICRISDEVVPLELATNE